MMKKEFALFSILTMVSAFAFAEEPRVGGAKEPAKHEAHREWTRKQVLEKAVTKLIREISKNPKLEVNELIFDAEASRRNRAKVGVALYEGKESSLALSLALKNLVQEEAPRPHSHPPNYGYNPHAPPYGGYGGYPYPLPMPPPVPPIDMTVSTDALVIWDGHHKTLASRMDQKRSGRSSNSRSYTVDGVNYTSSSSSYSYSWDSRTDREPREAAPELILGIDRGKAPSAYVFLFAYEEERNAFADRLDQGLNVGLPFPQTNDLAVTQTGAAKPLVGNHFVVPFAVVRRVPPDFWDF